MNEAISVVEYENPHHWAADPGAVAIPVGLGRPAELGRQVLIRDPEQRLAQRRVLQRGQIHHLLDLGRQFGVGEVQAGVGHADGHRAAAGAGLPALGQADAPVVPEQALVVEGRVRVDPGGLGRGGGWQPHPGATECAGLGEVGRAGRVLDAHPLEPVAAARRSPAAGRSRRTTAPPTGTGRRRPWPTGRPTPVWPAMPPGW